MAHRSISTCTVEICLAGDYAEAVRAARAYCDAVGLCVTVTRARYVYTGGDERGVIVRLAEYPRFPLGEDVLWDHALALGECLIERLRQQTAMLIGVRETFWLNYRDEK